MFKHCMLALILAGLVYALTPLRLLKATAITNRNLAPQVHRQNTGTDAILIRLSGRRCLPSN